MQKMNQVDKDLERIWEPNRNYVRRMLIAMSRDIDLADDLLQETYLQALSGFAGYRGDNPRAWLAAIAKNVFLQHKRQRYVRAEIPLYAGEEPAGDLLVDSAHNIDMIEIRKALTDLAPAFRYALVMKHYGGYTYSEIAEKLNCPEGTAKWRVSMALRSLRLALGVSTEDLVKMHCEEITDRRLLEYIYGRLPEAQMKAVKMHLAKCSACREQTEDVGMVLRALDATEGKFRMTSIAEIDRNGMTTDYFFWSWPNDKETALETTDFACGKNTNVVYIAVQGEEAPFEVVPHESNLDLQTVKVQILEPVAPGENVDMLLVGSPTSGPNAIDLGGGKWRFGPGKYQLTEDMVHVTAVRLPEGAKLITAMPDPHEVRTNNITTVVWRQVLPANEEFKFQVEYQM